MARRLARCTTRPSRIAERGARHRPAPIRPRGGCARAAAGLALCLSFAIAPGAEGAEIDSFPPAVAPFDLPGRELLGLPDRFAAEVQSIFRGLGVEASWRVGGNYGESPIPEVPVILLARDPKKGRGQTRVMGLVRRDQEPQRAVWLFMDGVRFALGDPRAGEVGYDAAVARALARVAAHEIVHAIAPDLPHAAAGLMRHALDKRFLLGKRAAIDTRCASSFRARLTAEWKQLVVRAPSTRPLSLLLP